MDKNSVIIRNMQIEDYPQIHELWLSIHGLGMRSIDDSEERITCFIKRNPTTNIVAVTGGQIIGTILCGHDGRRGCFYHVCVSEHYRKSGVGKKMVKAAMKALEAEQICKVSLVAFTNNKAGNSFWQSLGFTFRDDLNYYDYTLNQDNLTVFNE